MNVSSSTPGGLVAAANIAAQAMRRADLQLSETASTIARSGTNLSTPAPSGRTAPDPSRRPYQMPALVDAGAQQQDAAPAINLIEVQRAYESCIVVQRTVNEMANHTLDILR